LITREYAEEWFPDFVKETEKEIALANERVRAISKNVRLTSQPHRVRTNFDPEPGYASDYYWTGPRVREVAKLALEGMTKAQIQEVMGIKPMTIQNYCTMARAAGLLPSDFIVHEK